MIVDDLVQGPVGRELSIVGCPDMLDVNFFVGHRFSRCRVLSPLRHRLFTRGGALSPVCAAPLASGFASAATVGGRKIGSNWRLVWLACTSQSPFRAVSKERIGLLKLMAAPAHESSSGSRQHS